MLHFTALLASLAMAASDTVPLYRNLGSHHYQVTTGVPLAQRYFDQGLRLYYAFNHAEAVRAFREAQRLDPACAMCFFGEALAWGPNINLPMDSAAGVEAFRAVERARTAGGASARERALIGALATRYRPVPPADRGALDSAYARALGELSRLHPRDPEIAVLHAEAVLDLQPWNYWTRDRSMRPGIAVAIGQLERVIARDPNHPGACHFYIHAVEAAFPARAVACAERLAKLMPGAGHLVHMPGHIYIRVGRYADAIVANEHAVHADETYIRDQRPGTGMYTAGYYPHNYDFMAFAAAMAGRTRQAIGAADKLAQLATPELMRLPGMAFMQHHSTRRLQLRVRFERWAEILASPAPAPEFAHARGMWHYARGRALAASGRHDEAAAALDSVRRAAGDPRLRGVRLEFNEAPALLEIASAVLEGWIEAARGNFPAATSALERAAALEDQLSYGEPPDWTVPVRQDLGAVLLQAGKAEQAANAFRDDLARFPSNGWSLQGLAEAFEAMGHGAEARRTRAALKKAWADADTAPAGSGQRARQESNLRPTA